MIYIIMYTRICNMYIINVFNKDYFVLFVCEIEVKRNNQKQWAQNYIPTAKKKYQKMFMKFFASVISEM